MTKPSVLEQITSYSHGDLNFIAAFCRKLKIGDTLDQMIPTSTGRPSDIPYGTLAEVMITMICVDHHPLYRISEFFSDKDVEGIFQKDMTSSQLTDARFGLLLDHLYEAGPRTLFSKVCAYALSHYNIHISQVNYDTTSKVMWGEYETDEGKTGVVQIEFGHSKDKRPDKKQLKIGLGTSNGVVIDAQVLDGNKDDKTFNSDTLENIQSLAKNLSIDLKNLVYIADSALFTKKNLDTAAEKGVFYITRVPDNVKISKKMKEQFLHHRKQAEAIEIKTSQPKPSRYQIQSFTDTYQEHACQFIVCESEQLRATKEKKVAKQVEAERIHLKQLIKSYSKQTFDCEKDALKEEQKLHKQGKKLKFHRVTTIIASEEKKRRGRPANQPQTDKEYLYHIQFEMEEQPEQITSYVDRESLFVLASNHPSLSGEQVLREYKTQSTVEARFQQLKSPQFVHALYLDRPERIEALTYLILLSLMVLSFMETVVRREMAIHDEVMIGPGKVKMKRPTFRSILIIMGINIKVLKFQEQRHLEQPLKDNQRRILEILQLDETIFTSGKNV